jgi:esterase FrsA
VPGQYASAPVLIYTGGVDTYKMGLHAIYVALAQRLGITILGFDISGTGESTIPLSVKGDELVLGIVKEARKLGNGRVAHLGFSFGGNFSAMTGLSGAVDAAIVLGGPVDKAWGKENAQNLPFGMPGIVGNDMGFDKEPSFPEFMAAVQQFSRRPLLDQTKKRSDARHQRRKRLFRPAGGYARLQRSPQNRSLLATGHWTLCRVGWRLEAARSD